MERRNRLKAKMVEGFWDAKTFSTKTNISVTTISGFLTGRLFPKDPEIKIMARALKIKISEFKTLL